MLHPLINHFLSLIHVKEVETEAERTKCKVLYFYEIHQLAR